MKIIPYNSSYMFFIKLYDNFNNLYKLKPGELINFGIKENKDIYLNKKYTIFKRIGNSNFIENEGYLVYLMPEETKFKKDKYYYDIGLRYIQDNVEKYRFLQKSEKILVEKTVTRNEEDDEEEEEEDFNAEP